jgi:hypothetical protein
MAPQLATSRWVRVINQSAPAGSDLTPEAFDQQPGGYNPLLMNGAPDKGLFSVTSR